MSCLRTACVVVLAGFLWIGTLGGCAEGPTPRTELSWQDDEGFRWAALDVRERGGSGFEPVDSVQSGIGFVNTLSQEAFLSNRHYVNGSGVAVGDVNGDDWPDLFLARLEGPNALYLNEGAASGGFRFTAVPAAGGAALEGDFSTGAALEDLDGDGDLDLIVTTMGGPNAAFRNDGTGRFARYAAGLHTGEGSTTVALADIDTDGDLDLYVGNYKKNTVKDLYPPEVRRFERVVVQQNGEYSIIPEFQEHYKVRRQVNRLMRFEYAEADRLYLNDGTGRFSEVSMTGGAFRTADGAPLQEAPRDWALVARFQDLNGDGVADLYVCNDFESPDHVWLGDGEGGFQAVDPHAIRKTSHASMAVDFTDLERDGDIDFFVADMLARSYIDRQAQVGMQDPMPEAVGEIDNRPQEMQNTLFVNRGDGTWAELAELAGVEASGWTWSALFLDVDLDGYEDLLLTNGHHYNAMDADTQTRLANMGYSATRNWRRSLLEFPDLDLHNAAYRNRGDGTFEAVPEGWGLGREADVAHGLATGDFDRDGDLDVVVSRLNAPVGLFRNTASAARVAVRLRGRGGGVSGVNPEGIGARVTVRPLASGDGDAARSVPVQTKEVVAGGQYLSDSAAQVAFAVGEADSVSIEVVWPGGGRSAVTGAVNRLYEIEAPSGPSNRPSTVSAESRARTQWTPSQRDKASPFRTAAFHPVAQAAPSENTDSTLFDDVSDRLDHAHAEERYGDFQRQPLLSRRLSQQGPAAAWADVDGDGDDDLLIGSGRGGALAFYRNDGAGQFQPVAGEPMDTTVERDLTGIVVLPRSGGGAWVFVGRSNYERRPDEPALNSQVLMYEASGSGLRLVDELDAGPSSVGPLALTDVDGDGDVDLFAGGRHVPSGYPESASSRIFVNEGDGQFTYSERLSRPFSQAGMVSGVVAGDFDADADQDLVLAMEWGPLAYFENQGRGQFTDRTDERGLSPYTGLWNGVSAGDFDGDGRLDLVGTNWGWNSTYGRPPGRLADIDTPMLPHPLRVYYADFDRNGIMDVVETKYYEERSAYLPLENLSSIALALPYVRQRMRSFDQFAQSSLDEIFGAQRMQGAAQKEAATLSTMVFLNRDGGDGVRFDGQNLPVEAQYTPAFAPTVGDFDGDGHEDIVLSQNFFAVEIETPRQDAGRALMLRGQGNGAFDPVLGQTSGLKVYGEQRAAPASDIDGDGRTDVVVTQNGAATKLFRNTGATPGLRVRLDGPANNPGGIGAIVRLRYADGSTGPARVVAAGSGYWSQSSLTAVMGRGEQTVAAVHVQWMDGTESSTDVAADATTATVVHPSAAASR